MTRVFSAFCCALLLLVLPSAAAAQARDARLLLTVLDQTGAIIPNAVVTAVRLDDAKKTVIGPVKTSDKGVATLTDLLPGMYAVEAEFPGFEKRMMPSVRLRAGENKQVAILAIQGLQDSVTVERDKQVSAADPKTTFGTALTREQIEALSDDPDEMRRQIMDMAPDAVLRIDSFVGGQLPPKAQIKSIHIARDQFAAESHYAGAHFIDIITQPGIGPMRYGTRLNFRDSALNARNPLTPTKGNEQGANFGFNVGGTLIQNRSGFNLSINGSQSFDTPNLYASSATGLTRSENINLRRHRDNMSAFGSLDYAITKDQTLRLSFDTFSADSTNQGVGAFDEESRAYSSEDRNASLRIQEAGPIGRRFFINTRMQLAYSDTNNRSAVELPTIRITDAFTRGGAQQAGGRLSKSMNLMSDLDYIRGIHSFRTGVEILGSSYRSDESSNYLGTYTFESLAAFNAGAPRSYTQRIGNPNIKYSSVQAGVYVQDDIRVRKNLTISTGLRYELQNHLKDFNNFAPRFGVNWAPFKSGRTTIRASSGIFYDWFSAGTYEQTLRVDGFRQQELNIVNPSYPDPGTDGIIAATNRYLMNEDQLGMVRTVRFSVGIQQTLTPRIRVGGTYSDSRGAGLLRGVNLNAPVNGVRPDPRFANIIEVENDARSEQQQLSTNFGVSFMTPSPAAAGARFNIKRGSVNAGYTIGRTRNNTDGAFSPPFSGSPAGEWGASNQDVRHRANVGINSQALKNANLFLSFNMASAPPYTIRTGRDDNGDLVFNDRPDGFGRNTERGKGVFNSSAGLSYTFSFGKRPPPAGPGAPGVPGMPGGMPIMIEGGGGRVVMMGPGGPAAGAARYRLSFNLNVQNVTNRVNRTGYNGSMTSPFFRQPTNVTGARRIDLGMSFNF
jgi:hypothetical protein